jgi:biotin transport system substrate-specific component
MACLTGLLAQARIYLPWTPVPITGQTIAVMLAGMLLGKCWGGISMAIYGIMGIAGIPWLSGATSGWGPTSGYLLGFILAALLIGHFSENYADNPGIIRLFVVMLMASFLVYIPGMLWLNLYLTLVKQQSAALLTSIQIGILPFISGDIIKAAVAAGIARILLPKNASNLMKQTPRS